MDGWEGGWPAGQQKRRPWFTGGGAVKRERCLEAGSPNSDAARLDGLVNPWDDFVEHRV